MNVICVNNDIATVRHTRRRIAYMTSCDNVADTLASWTKILPTTSYILCKLFAGVARTLVCVISGILFFFSFLCLLCQQ